jgi:hypothetical protein
LIDLTRHAELVSASSDKKGDCESGPGQTHLNFECPATLQKNYEDKHSLFIKKVYIAGNINRNFFTLKYLL